jgi:hypothetical protein
VGVHRTRLQGVLALFTGLFQVGGGFLRSALGFQVLVVSHLAGRFLDLALGFAGGVFGLVTDAHRFPPHGAASDEPSGARRIPTHARFG